MPRRLVSCIDCARSTAKGADARLAAMGFFVCSHGTARPGVLYAARFERECSEFRPALDAENRRAWLKKKEGSDARKV